MSKKLELFYFPECPFCQIVLRKIEQLKINSIAFSNIREDSAKLQKLIKDTGRKTVPCLYIDNVPVHESSDIAQWLDSHHQELK